MPEELGGHPGELAEDACHGDPLGFSRQGEGFIDLFLGVRQEVQREERADLAGRIVKLAGERQGAVGVVASLGGAIESATPWPGSPSRRRPSATAGPPS